jgi:hypothetical protein
MRGRKNRFFALYLALAALATPVSLPGSGKGVKLSDSWYALVVNSKPTSISTELLQILSVPSFSGVDDSAIISKDRALESAIDELLARDIHLVNDQLDDGFLRYSKGKSASLVLSLALLDNSTSGSLTNGMKVGASGVLFYENDTWTVYPVSSVDSKIKAAKAMGLDLLYLPKNSTYSKESIGYRSFIRSGGEIVEVGTLREVLSDLCARGGEDELCRAEAV